MAHTKLEVEDLADDSLKIAQIAVRLKLMQNASDAIIQKFFAEEMTADMLDELGLPSEGTDTTNLKKLLGETSFGIKVLSAPRAPLQEPMDYICESLTTAV